MAKFLISFLSTVLICAKGLVTLRFLSIILSSSMAPPKLSLASSRMTTRAKNKDIHPGYVDLPSPRRVEALELGTNGQKSPEEKEEEALRCTEAAKKAAALQDHLRRQDQEKEQRRAKQREIGKNGNYMH